MLLGPYMADWQYSIDERLINAASNLLLTVFLAAIVSLASAPAPARQLLPARLRGASIFIQDTLVTLEVVGGPNATIGRALAPAIYVFFGVEDMHPDRHLMTEPPRQFDVSLSWRRITLLVGALLIAPAMICLQLAFWAGTRTSSSSPSARSSPRCSCWPASSSWSTTGSRRPCGADAP